MFDNLRDDSSFYEDEQNEPHQEPEAQAQPAVATQRSARFLGMTAQQRFILSIMLLITVCVMGMLAMIATGRMGF